MACQRPERQSNHMHRATGVFLSKLIGFCAIGAVALVAIRGHAQTPAAAASPATTAAQKIDYNWDVRPILSDNCYRCHGPDAKRRQAGLRLDQQEGAYAQGITPGKARD